MRQRHLCNQRGISLTEVLVVIALIGVLTGLSVIAMQSDIEKLSRAQAETRLRDTLGKARHLAITSGKCVAINVEAQRITVTTYPITVPCAFPLPAPDSTLVVDFESNIELSPFLTGNPILLNRRGGTNYNQPTVMNLRNTETGFESSFAIYPAIGQVRKL